MSVSETRATAYKLPHKHSTPYSLYNPAIDVTNAPVAQSDRATAF